MKKTLYSFLFSYLRFFAHLQLQKIKLLNPKLLTVGITGSAGKTSTLLACETALKPNFKVKTNYGGNSETGLPLNILGIKNPDYSLLSWTKVALLIPLKFLINWKIYDIYLLEMGIDSATFPKNMSFLLSIIIPDIGIFLNVTPVHLENFSSLDEIAIEKSKLINSTKIAIINDTDQLVKKYTTNKKVISIKPIKIYIPNFYLPDIYQISLGAAITLAKHLKIDQKTAITNLQNNFTLPPSRSSVFKGLNNSTIIDSSYNSSPLATLEMLNFLHTFKSPRIALLGDMRELGKSAKKSHQEIYQKALKSADTIISVGPQTSRYFGLKAKKFLYWWQASDYLKNNLPQNSTILVKGSQNTIFLEEVVKTLLQNKSDSKKICRQSSYWLKLKNKFRNSFELSTK